MIELNLLERKKAFKLPIVIGVDLNLFNFKMLGFSFFLFYIPEIFIRIYYDDKVKVEEEILSQMENDVKKTNREIEKSKDIKLQLEAFNKHVEKLKARSNQVDEILKIRTNPRKLLEKIARSTPEDLWFDQLKINDKNEIAIIGGAYSSRSIGEFITIINDSPFFGNTITPIRQENKQEVMDGETVSFESFELKGKIKNYEMISR